MNPVVLPAPEPTRRARAAVLTYDPVGTDAQRGPRVVAKGERLLAEEIIARARAAGVPVHESRELVSLLMQVDLDAHIPPALYVAVAEVLAWAYRLENGAVGATTPNQVGEHR
jgi:flagellar biosynthesis protein